ncbi:chemotaxis-specific protein-glutamate methyltransferase CheB [Dyella nitratireducens]|uniref:chemotaxis-specific protein-glutamate methyltransferase CheB n=1 Tax=Dyella nitratireducens TaxID=1849580 RepID=UPI0016684CB0|nr:chemotaxis-specific protein-glutamate methyltransferase CheB [Dyella nitratireducens]
MIKVLVVEDSSVVRDFLVYVLGSDPDLDIVGTARDGEEALDAVRRYRPDVITMDLHMPKMDGLEATRRIMETMPTPIVIVSGSHDAKELAATFKAIEAGALTVMATPKGMGHPHHASTAKELVQAVKLMSEIKLVRRWPRTNNKTGALPETIAPSAPARIRVVAIGASTGGPPAIQTVLGRLSKEFPLPVLIVQHMTASFTEGFVEWLRPAIKLPIQVARNHEVMKPGHVYVAPDGFQMKVSYGDIIVLTTDPPESGSRPSASYLFRSVAEVYGGEVIAGLLSGMGRDGAQALQLLREKGAITFAQDEASSVVHGMPGEAIRLHAAMHVLPLDKIAEMVIAAAHRRS